MRQGSACRVAVGFLRSTLCLPLPVRQCKSPRGASIDTGTKTACVPIPFQGSSQGACVSAATALALRLRCELNRGDVCISFCFCRDAAGAPH